MPENSPSPRPHRLEIRVQSAPFDPGREQDALRRDAPAVGALVAFVGLMRDSTADQRVFAMTLEHYPGMTERALAAIADEAARRWALDGIHIVHRVGRLLPGEPIVLVAVTARHRGEAFRAAEFLIDALKTGAPFWKREETATGAHWVEARDTDAAAIARWTAGDAAPAPG